jgi:hypothetical protein
MSKKKTNDPFNISFRIQPLHKIHEIDIPTQIFLQPIQ